MKYQYEEIQDNKSKLPAGLVEGKANYTILKSTDGVSKSSGKPRIEFHLKLWDCNGKEVTGFDYLSANAPWRIKSACVSVGHPEWYSPEGDLPAENFLDQSGLCTFYIEKDDKYGDKVKIKKYLPAEAVETQADNDDSQLNDEIPF